MPRFVWPLCLAILLVLTAVSLRGQLTRGPQVTITCPTGSVDIWPGQWSQTTINQHAAGATFCLRAGVHAATAPVTPRTGDTFIGEYGAILDGSTFAWQNYHDAAIMAHNQNIDDVTIRNLTIRKMPRYAIKAYFWQSDRWTLEYNDIVDNVFGIDIPNDSVARHNRILRNVGVPGAAVLNGGGYGANRARNAVFENNEIASNGPEQKIVHAFNVAFRRNHVHHNQHNGIWYDGDSPGSIVEDNTIEDHPVFNVFLEVAQSVIVRRNTIKRGAWGGVELHMSRDMQVYENQIEATGAAVALRTECSRYGGGELPLKWDLTNNTIRDNTITVTGGRAAEFYVGGTLDPCSAELTQAYLSNAKNNQFLRNTYTTPSTTGAYWAWTSLVAPSRLTLSQWRALPQDVVVVEPPPPPPPPAEVCGDGIDNNGDGRIDEGCATQPPPPLELCGDGLDNDADGQIDEGCAPPPPADTIPPTIESYTTVKIATNKYRSTATVSDDVAVVTVDLKLDGVTVGTCTTPPISTCAATFAIGKRGQHSLEAIARDAAGNEARRGSTVTKTP